MTSTSVEMKSVARPSESTPWSRRTTKMFSVSGLACVLPLAVTIFVANYKGIPGAAALLAIFLPLQIIVSALAAVIVGGKRGIPDAILTVTVLFFVSLVLVMMSSIIVSVVTNGFHAISLQFLFFNNNYVTSNTSLDYGGVGHAILGSIVIVSLASIFAIPLGMGVGIFITESRSPMRGPVRFVTQSMTGLPSIVAGLFIYTLLIIPGIFEKTGLTASLALMLLMMPTVARMTEEVLLLVPQDLRSAALALGAPKHKAFFQVVLPAARSGIVTAILLGLARIVGETAPLLLLTWVSELTNVNPLAGAMAALPTYIFQWVGVSSAIAVQRAWGAALVLLTLVGFIFVLARYFSRQKFNAKGK
jgi:phosphate transport system permease protein